MALKSDEGSVGHWGWCVCANGNCDLMSLLFTLDTPVTTAYIPNLSPRVSVTA